jgi:flagellar protein FlaI
MTNGEKEPRSMSEIIKKLTKQNEEKSKGGSDAAGQTPQTQPNLEKEDKEEAQKKLSGLISKMREYETEGSLEEKEEPQASTIMIPGIGPVKADSKQDESTGKTEKTEAPPAERKEEVEAPLIGDTGEEMNTPPIGKEGLGDEDATLKDLINNILESHDEVMEEKTPPKKAQVSSVNLDDLDVPDTSESMMKGDAGSSTAGESASIISVDEVDDYSALILPKGATFHVEDFHLNSSLSAFDLVGKEGALTEIDEIWRPDFPMFGLEGEKFGELEEEEEEKKKGVFGFLKTPARKVHEYDYHIHGPLVDLSMEAAPGIEEVELYPVNEPYGYIRVLYDNNTHEYTYSVIEPVLNSAENELVEEITQRLFETLDVSTKDLSRDGAHKALRDAVDEIIHDYGIKLTPVSREKILYHIEKNFLGDGLIDPIMHDKYIEDISCDGLNTPIFVYHISYESIKSNLMYSDPIKLDSFVTKLAQRAGKYISIAEPMLDATMGDGSRIQMTLGKEVTAHGSTFTIRKFKDEPITPTDLIEWSTFSPLSIAFIWLAVENGKSMIFAGGTASGKTTSLNAISLFIPPLSKIVSLEDTRELKLPHPNWIPSVTRDSFDTGGRGEIDMYELLRAALRQRPEYLLVGEVRGKEALTLFQAMSTGHVTYATMHADSVASVVHRLENPPLNVPRNMLNALDLVSVQVQARIGGQRIRRSKQLIEILDIDPRTNELITNEVFKWYPATDEIRYSGKSYILEEIMEERGWSEARMREELKRRQEILEWMRIKKLRHYKDVSKVLISYYRDPEAVMDIVRGDLYE